MIKAEKQEDLFKSFLKISKEYAGCIASSNRWVEKTVMGLNLLSIPIPTYQVMYKSKS